MNFECPKNISFLSYVLLLLLLSHCSRVRFCATPQTAAHLTPPVPGILQARTLEWVAIYYVLNVLKSTFPIINTVEEKGVEMHLELYQM